eukprot:CAMPEP_0194438754 /NCGR_PEP_ID=MMETSP0176-20130528/106646_1 /TAXON_ID=216777 /ORGANISM="Proboscia alata, Strain PI-D3" /LENGTH=51 /DNA_ID=CAMNT_0039261225 /DNA_START=13 /DNA_END=168 /DNA_ORIENTATION=-
MTEHRIELLNEIGLELDATTTLESTKPYLPNCSEVAYLQTRPCQCILGHWF